MPPIRTTLFFLICLLGFTGCAVKPQITNEYTLSKYGTVKRYAHNRQHPSIYVGIPEAINTFQTEQMLYMTTPYEISAFAHHGWKSPPADMLYPLIQQSIQDSHYFSVVASGSHAEMCNYHLNTEILDFKQNFLTNPSRIELKVKVMLTNTSTDEIIATKILRESVICPHNNFYGGVLAANQATTQLTREITQFVITEVKHHSRAH